MSYDYDEETETTRTRKGKKFTMILSPEQAELLEMLAEATGKNQKEVILEALEMYAQGRIIDWKALRGDHILAVLTMLDKFANFLEKLQRITSRVSVSALAEQLMSTKQLAEALKQIGMIKEAEEKAEKEEKTGGSGENEELLYYLLLGLMQKLGLVEVEPELAVEQK